MVMAMAMETEISMLSDDLVRSILMHVDVANLFRCAATCKLWRRLIAEPSFLCGYPWPSPLAGFFVQRCHVPPLLPGFNPVGGCTGLLTFLPSFGSSSPPVLGRSRRLSSFFRDAAIDDLVLDRALPLASHGGLLLLRLGVPDERVVCLAVCNILAGACHVLPGLDCRGRTGFSCFEPGGCAIVPDDPASAAAAFRVLMICADKYVLQFNLHVFSFSGSGGERSSSWRAPIKCFDMIEHKVWSMEHESAVVCNGTAHWLFHVLDVGPAADGRDGRPRVTLTKLVSPNKQEEGRRPEVRLHDADRLITTAAASPSSAAADGTKLALSSSLSLSVYRHEGHKLEIWTRGGDDADDDAAAADVWVRTRVVELEQMVRRLGHPTCVHLGEKSGMLLTVHDRRQQSVYIADLETGAMEEEVTEHFAGFNRLVAMEIDWPAFFASRLGGRFL